jgi:hypothetical protein
MARGHTYSTEQLAWLRAYSDKTRSQLTELFNRRWGTRLSVSAIKGTCLRHGIKTGRTGRFVKGGPYIDGSGSKRGSPTSFKPGHLPHNHNPIGHVRISKDGYQQVKLTDTRNHRRDYHFIHRLVWQHYHGDIPPGHIIVFRDGDKWNFNIDNLELISRAVHAVRCKMGYYNYPPELKPQLDALVTIKQTLARRKRDEAPQPHQARPA